MVGFFIQRPIFASAIAVDPRAGGLHLLFSAAGRAVPRHHAAAGRRQRRLSGRERAGRRRHGNHAAGAADQRRCRHDLHVVVELQRRLFDDHHHVRRRLSAEYRSRRRAESRRAGGIVAAADRQSGRGDDQEAEPELRPHRQSHLAGRFGRSGGAQQLRLSADRRSAQASAGRRRRPDLRRAPLFDARLARSRQAGESRHHRRRRAECGRRAECAGRRRQDRPVAGPRGHAVRDAGERGWPIERSRPVRRHRGARECGRRLGRAAPRRRPHRAWSAPVRIHGVLRRRPDGGAGDLSDGRLECPRSAAERQGQDGGAVEALSQGHRLRHALRHDAFRLRRHARCRHHFGTGADSGRRRCLRLPPELAHHDHSHHRDSGVVDRDPHCDEDVRLLAQHAEPARHGAGDRPRRRRCDRGGGKCRAAARGRPAAARCDARRR